MRSTSWEKDGRGVENVEWNWCGRWRSEEGDKQQQPAVSNGDGPTCVGYLSFRSTVMRSCLKEKMGQLVLVTYL